MSAPGVIADHLQSGDQRPLVTLFGSMDEAEAGSECPVMAKSGRSEGR